MEPTGVGALDVPLELGEPQAGIRDDAIELLDERRLGECRQLLEPAAGLDMAPQDLAVVRRRGDGVCEQLVQAIPLMRQQPLARPAITRDQVGAARAQGGHGVLVRRDLGGDHAVEASSRACAAPPGNRVRPIA